MNAAPAGTILVIVDPTARHHTGVAKGALLAQRSGACVELFCRGGQLSKARSPAAVSLVLQATAILEALARPLRDHGLNVTTQAACAGPMHMVLADRVKQSCAKLVIKDVHRQSTSQRALLSDADWELIRDCPVSLLLSKPRLWSEAPRICAAVDSGHRRIASVEQAVLEQGAALARQLEGGLHVMPVSDVLCSSLSQLAASIVVLGALSCSNLRRGVAGSTTEALVGQVPCDALVVKEPESTGLSALS